MTKDLSKYQFNRYSEPPLSYMNISDLKHQKDSFYEYIKQTYD